MTTKVKEPKAKKEKILKPSEINSIEAYLTDRLNWVKRAKKKEEETGTPTQLNLQQFLAKEHARAIDLAEEAYSDALNARSDEQKHEALLKIIESRRSAASQDRPEQTEEEAQVLEEIKDSEEQTTDEEGVLLRSPRKKGFLERRFDELSATYEDEPTAEARDEMLDIVSRFEVNRRVRFYYDLQKLRVGANNRREIYAQNYGIRDLFIDSAGDQLETLEARTEKMVDRILSRSPDGAFYEYLRDTYLGCGVMMAGCIISEVAAPERFRTVSALWKYCGLAVVGQDPDTGAGGHAQRKARGEPATWNHFLRTKLLGVLSGCMIKAQTRYVGTEDEAEKARNVLVLNGYKLREVNKQSLIPERERYYTEKGKEIFQYNSSKPIPVYTKDGRRVGEIAPRLIRRRSKAHIQKMAVRYMIKMFLADILNEWRELKGFERLLTYDEAKLRGGIPHGGFNNRQITPAKTRIVPKDQPRA